METGRRFFLSSFPVFLAGAKSLLAGQQRQGPQPGVTQIPDASSSGRPGDDVPSAPPPDPKVQLRENQKSLRQDADHLVQLAKDLKDEADKTQQTDVLSLSLVKKAEEVEKLAKQIRDLARSS